MKKGKQDLEVIRFVWELYLVLPSPAVLILYLSPYGSCPSL